MKNTEQIFEEIRRKPFSFRAYYEAHKIGILGTLVFHFALLLLFLVVKINQYRNVQNLDVYIDFSQIREKTPEELEAEKQKKEEEEYYQRLLDRSMRESNRAVNVSKDLDEKISTQDYVKEIEKELESSRSKEYLDEQAKINKILNQEDVVPVNTPDQEKKDKGDYHGPTNITYKFSVPPYDRKAVDLPVPVYKCMGDGIVDVHVTVDQSGNVTSAKASVVNASMDPDCLSEVAEKYARRTVFSGNLSAPVSQPAVITYQFVAQ